MEDEYINMRVEMPTVVVPVVEREPEVVRLLRLARARLTPETWGQGGCTVPFQGLPGVSQRLCTVTACWLDLNLPLSSTEFAAKILLRACVPRMESVPKWNDAPERTLADVHALYDRAIELALRASAA